MVCLDVGCGGGDVSFDLARLVEPDGRVVAIDADEIKIEIARHEAGTRKIANIDFRVTDFEDCELTTEFDFAFSRFVLSHLQSPAKALAKIRQALRPGGIVALVDTDFRGVFCEPHSEAVKRGIELYIETLKRHGGDANIGPRLPGLLSQSGFENVQMSVAQHATREGSEKVLIPLTLEFIADAAAAERLATRADIDALVAEMYEYARDPNTVLSGPRTIQAWGYRPSS